MADLRDITGYICDHYPNQNDLSKARVAKLIYLADWKFCLERGKQMSTISWIFNHFGPYVDDVEIMALESPYFNIDRTYNIFGERKDLISLKSRFDFKSLSDDEKTVLDDIINRTASLNWEQFKQLVYSTYPIIVSSRMDQLDLPKLALEYKKTLS
jgi:hypothetical protein